MSVTRKLATAAVFAALATVGFTTTASAQVPEAGPNSGQASANEGNMRWYGVKDDGALVSASDNNVGPFQACDNDVPVNGVGGQVPASDLIGILGISSGNNATLVKTCNQGSHQANDGEKAKPATHRYRWNDDDKLASVDNNNVGPVQACHNNVPVNGVGGQVPIQDATAILGISSDGNNATGIKTCDQESQQDN